MYKHDGHHGYSQNTVNVRDKRHGFLSLDNQGIHLARALKSPLVLCLRVSCSLRSLRRAKREEHELSAERNTTSLPEASKHQSSLHNSSSAPPWTASAPQPDFYWGNVAKTAAYYTPFYQIYVGKRHTEAFDMRFRGDAFKLK